MLTIDRLSQRRLALWAVASLLHLGACTLITDVDRSKIPQPPVIAPDPDPLDAGERPGLSGDSGNDAASPDAAPPDAAPSEPELELDAGLLDAGDTGPDGG